MPQPHPDDPPAYRDVKRRVGALHPDRVLVVLATGLDPDPRPIRTASLIAEAGVVRVDGDDFTARGVEADLQALAGEGLVAREGRGYRVPASLRLAAVMTAYAQAPGPGQAIAEGLLRVTGYEPVRPPGPGRRGRAYRDWNYVYDYEAFPGRVLLLMLAGRPREYAEQLADLQQHHEWRVPERKREALAAAMAPLRHFDYDFWRAVHPEFQAGAFEHAVLGHAAWDADTAPGLADFLANAELADGELHEHERALLGYAAAQAMPHYAPRSEAHALHPGAGLVAAAATGEDARAQALWERLPERPDQRPAGLHDILGEVYALRGGEGAEAVARRVNVLWQAEVFPAAVQAFTALVNWRLGRVDLAERTLAESFAVGRTPTRDEEFDPEDDAPGFRDSADGLRQNPLEWMVGLWVFAWTGLKPNPRAADLLLARFGESLDQAADADGAAEATGLPPIAYQPYVRGELLNALAHVFPSDPRARGWREDADAIAQRHGLRYLLRLLPVPQPFEYALRVLDAVAGSANGEQDAERDTRLLWVVDLDAGEVIPREQRRGKRGWSKGRRVKPEDLVEAAGRGRFDADDDRAIGGAAVRYDGREVALGRSYGAGSVRLELGGTLYHLAGHPRVVLGDDKRVPLELRRARPQLTVDEEPDGGLRLSFEPAAAHRAGYHYEKETPTRYRVYAITDAQANLSRALGRQTVIPAEHRGQVDERLEAIRQHVPVVATAELEAEDLPEVHGDTRPCAHLLPYGEAYKLELYARPLPGEELYLRIGEGATRQAVVREADPADEGDAAAGERVLLVRDLAAEERAADAVVADCPTLGRLRHEGYEWTLDDDYAALRVLLELRQLQVEERLTVEHPKGQRIRLIGNSAADAMRLQIRKERDWFAVDGQLVVDEGRVIGMRALLEHLRRGGGEFVELSEGEFVAITAELRSRLEAIEGLVRERAGGQVALPPLAAPAFAEYAEEFDELEVDEAWRETLTRIRAAEEFDPALPPGFQGQLRPYQLEGYRWLRRLAEWGVGGCLADDMGLGKTVQALALLAARAHEGPALVIAPASVTRNWVSETRRFTPGLSPKLVATSADAGMLAGADAGDVLVISYGLLSFLEEALLEARYATVILDEAQAIKNPATKRAKLIFRLDADMRVATTGTPIENHLGELWSLFRYLNPGLLGGRQAFNEQFAGPIRREGDRGRTEALRRLVRPFILRRRKEEVLTELPPKTEVNLAVELSEGERSLYEAVRREAVDAIDNANPQAQRMIVLQHLTRLRQAACHPRLIRPQSPLPSAKLQLVGDTLLEIVETGHRALVFSQFVRHLRLVEAWVQAAGLRYCYLDGSTPGGKRQREVDRFQAGEAEVFLISLKAGGTGLNLTAADYVLHLDPWWNPAAEDQASDRAHRIGQERPVTVYRFVSQGTIEERILALHAEKRDLADQILQGTDAGGRLSVAEVVDLLREEDR